MTAEPNKKNVFGLVLCVTNACNLRCSYCYAGPSRDAAMPESTGRKAIDRALNSLTNGGMLELGFFGGEPLLEAKLITCLWEYATEQASLRSITVRPDVTTNGTIDNDDAWSLMTNPELQLAISYDGLPEIHDKHRHGPEGGSAKQVLSTITSLISADRSFRVIMVVRPDTMTSLPAGIECLQHLGVNEIHPSLDLWVKWSKQDIEQLEKVTAQCARVWRAGLPDLSVGWFDDKAGYLLCASRSDTARCGFGDGELAVSPSGRLYPCERLIGEDRPDHPMLLGHDVFDGDDFLNIAAADGRSQDLCGSCRMQQECNTTCRCSNYIRTGDVTRPDRLLCTWNQACLNATAEALRE